MYTPLLHKQRSTTWTKKYYTLECNVHSHKRTEALHTMETSLEEEEDYQSLVKNNHKSIFQKLKKWLAYMEIPYFIYAFSFFLTSAIIKDVLLDSICRVNLNMDDDICDQLQSGSNRSMYEDEEKETQKYLSSIQTWSSVLDNIFPPFITLMLGAWSDTHGRKLPMIIALTGYVIRYAGLVTSIYIGSSWTAEIVAVIDSLPRSVTGSTAAAQLALYTYMTDTTTAKARTFRFAVANAVITIGRSLGTAASGFLIDQGGFGPTDILWTACGLMVFGIFYTIFLIPNTLKKKKKNDCDENGNDEEKSSQCSGATRQIFNYQNIVASLKSIFVKRQGTIRIQLITLLIAISCTEVPMSGESAMTYLYARYKFNWDAGDFGYFNSVNMISGFLGGVVAGILNRVLNLSDAFLGQIASCSQIGGSLVYAFAVAPWMMYLAPFVDILNGTMHICARSIMTKIVEPDEIGKISALIGVTLSLSRLPGGPIYSAIYRDTLDTFAGAAFFVSAGLAVPALIIFIFNWRWGRSTSKTETDTS